MSHVQGTRNLAKVAIVGSGQIGPDIALHFTNEYEVPVLQEAILQGVQMSLEEGLRFESRCFGEVCGLEDIRIGLDNFIQNGPRAKARFVHR